MKLLTINITILTKHRLYIKISAFNNFSKTSSEIYSYDLSQHFNSWKCVRNSWKLSSMFGQFEIGKIVTRSVFELQKSLSTQNSSPDNFQNIFLNKLLHRRPLTLIFVYRDVKNSCWQLMTAVDSCSDISIIIYSLRLISMPNFSSIRWSGAEILSIEVRFEQFCRRDTDTDRHSEI